MSERHRIQLTGPLIGVRVRPTSANAAPRNIGPTEEELRDQRQQQLQQELKDMKGVVEDLQFSMTEYETRRQTSLDELQKISVELGVLAAEHVAKAEIDKNNCGIDRLISSAIKKLNVLEPAKVTLHPADQEVLNHHMGKRDVPWDGKQITVTTDAGMQRGSVRLDAESGRAVVSNVKLRIDEVHESWMELVNAPQDEDRRVPQDAESMRRFPERRETA